MSDENYGESNAETSSTPSYSQAPQAQPSTPASQSSAPSYSAQGQSYQPNPSYQQSAQGYPGQGQGYQQAPQGYSQPANAGYYGYQQPASSGAPNAISGLFGSLTRSISQASASVTMGIIAAVLGVYSIFDSLVAGGIGAPSIPGYGSAFDAGRFFFVLLQDLLIGVVVLFIVRLLLECAYALYKKNSDDDK